jgi:WD40 repeat protein/tRNA A-37 threonylcarbamoyl transferase component Bud32
MDPLPSELKRSRCPGCGQELGLGVRPEFCPVCLLGEAAEMDLAEPYFPESIRRIGDYDLLEELARGGMGVVFKARQRSLGRIVAVKLMLGGDFATAEARARFRGEAAAAAQLQHPNIVAIHEIGEHEGQPYFSMDYIEGQTLADRVVGGPLPAELAARYLARVADAVEHAHQRGVLHRDLKPSNVMVDGLDEPRVTDFGLAKQMQGSGGLTATGAMLGSPAFAAPEQVRGEGNAVGVGADVYALGALLYQLLTGRPPFQGGNVQAVLRQVLETDPVSPRVLNPSVPADLETVCLKCLEKEPARRYPSARVMAEELGRFLSGEPVLARPLGWLGRGNRWARRRPAVAALAGALVLALVGIAVVGAVAAVRIVRAEHRAVRNLRESLLVQARSLRLAGGPGQQTASLAAIEQAMGLDPDAPLREWASRETIAAFGNTDVEFVPDPGALWDPHRVGPIRDGTVWRCRAMDGFIEDRSRIGVRSAIEGRTPVPDAIRLGSSSGDGDVQVVEDRESLMVLDLRSELPRHLVRLSPQPRHHALSSDGRWLVTADDGADLTWRDLEGGGVHRVPTGLAGWRWMGFTPDSQRLAVVPLLTNTVDLYGTTTRELEGRIQQPGPPAMLAWSADSQRFVAATSDGRIFYHDLPARGRILSFTFAPAQPRGMVLDPSGRLLATAWDDRTVRLWDLHAGRLLVEAPGDAARMAFHPDRLEFGPVQHRGRVGWYRVILHGGFEEVLAGYLGSSELDVRFSADSRWMAGRYQLGVRLFEVGRLQSQPGWILGVEFPKAMSFDGSGRWLGVVDRAGLGVWELVPGMGPVEGRQVVKAASGLTALTAASGTGGWWVGGGDGTIERIGPKPDSVPPMSMVHPGLDGLASEPGGRWMASIHSVAGEVRVWDLETGLEVHRMRPGAGAGAQFSLDGGRLAVWGGESALLETGSWKRIPVPIGADGPVLGVATFSPDGGRLAVVADVYGILWMDLDRGRTTTWIEPPTPLRIHALAWSPDGNWLAAATAQGKIRSWNLQWLQGELARRGLLMEGR